MDEDEIEQELQDFDQELDASTETEEADNPWDWAADYDPNQVRETFENVSKMQAEAHRRNEEARQVLERAERLSSMPQHHYPQHQHSPQREDLDDSFIDDGTRKYLQRMEQRMEQQEQSWQQRLNEMQYHNTMTQAQQTAREVLRSSEHGKRVLDYYGEDEATRRYIQRAFDPSSQVRQDQLGERVADWAQQDAAVIGAKEQQVIKRYLQSKAKAQKGNIPSSSGPRQPNRAMPPAAFKKPDWSKSNLSEADELALLEQVFNEATGG